MTRPKKNTVLCRRVGSLGGRPPLMHNSVQPMNISVDNGFQSYFGLMLNKILFSIIQVSLKI